MTFKKVLTTLSLSLLISAAAFAEHDTGRQSKRDDVHSTMALTEAAKPKVQAAVIQILMNQYPGEYEKLGNGEVKRKKDGKVFQVYKVEKELNKIERATFKSKFDQEAVEISIH